MANLITLARFLLLFVLIFSAYRAPPLWQLANGPLLTVIFVMDGIDGFVARKRHEESLFGAIFDIAIDRVVENVLWLVVVDLGFVPVWVAIVFLTRSFTVDAIRSHAASQGHTPFGMMQSPLGKFLVAGRGMRLFYGVLKAVAFGFIFLVQPWPALWPEAYGRWQAVIGMAQNGLVFAAVLICLVRGLPVIVEFVLSSGRARPPSRGNA
jgi:CDP-diacylglycerol--glycerol-3-phosphate 3-phosphatidyltransferase